MSPLLIKLKHQHSILPLFSPSSTPSPSLSLSQTQMDWVTNGGIVKKLSSIKEDEEGSEEAQHSPLPKTPRSPLGLGWGLRSPLRSPSRPTTLQIPVVSFSCAPLDLNPR